MRKTKSEGDSWRAAWPFEKTWKLSFPVSDEDVTSSSDITNGPETFITILFDAELSGVKQEDIELGIVNKSLLTLEFEKKYNCTYNSRSLGKYGSFKRNFSLPKGVDSVEDVDASFVKGVLEIVIKKPASEHPTRKRSSSIIIMDT